MKSALLALGLTCASACAQQNAPQPDAVSSATARARALLVQEVRSALADPYAYQRSGGLSRLVSDLQANPYLPVKAVPADSLTQTIEYAASHRNAALDLVGEIVLYAQVRLADTVAACRALDSAVAIAAEQIKDYTLALDLARLGSAACLSCRQAVSRIEFARTHNREIEQLLAVDWYAFDKSHRQGYVADLKAALSASPHSTLLAEGYRRLGDVYYGLGAYGAMKRAYVRALRIDPSLEKSTSLGYLLTRGSIILLNRELLAASAAAMAAVLAILLVRGIRGRREFDMSWLARRSAVLLGAYAVACVVFLGADAVLTSRAVLSGQLTGELSRTLESPFVPFGCVDLTIPRLGMAVLVLGFVPALVALVYVAGRRRSSRVAAVALALVTAAAVWTAFVAGSVIDGAFSKNVVRAGTHLFYVGELEDLLVKDPKKVLRANPELREPTNRALQTFLHDTYPQGLPDKGKP